MPEAPGQLVAAVFPRSFTAEGKPQATHWVPAVKKDGRIVAFSSCGIKDRSIAEKEAERMVFHYTRRPDHA